MTWLLEDELYEHYGRDRCRRIAATGLDFAGLDDAQKEAAITAKVMTAITSGYGQARSRLLRSRCFAPEALPQSAEEASEDLKRLTADLSWWHLHKRMEFQEEAVGGIREGALQELADIAISRDRATLFAELPDDSGGELIVQCIKRGPSADPPLTLDRLWD